MGKGISIRYNPRAREYEAYSTETGNKVIATFPDYQSAMEYYREEVKEKTENKNAD